MPLKKVYNLLWVLLIIASCSKSATTPPATTVTDVYIVGNIHNSVTGHSKPVYWKNDDMIELSMDGNPIVNATSMAINGNDIYIVGNKTSKSGTATQVIYWKNGIYQTASDNTSNAFATAIAVDGNDVYIVGSIGQGKKSAAYWKNGKMVLLNDNLKGSEATGIVIQGHDVYICGTLDSSPQNAVYWKNGDLVNISASLTERTYAYAIAISGSTVYLAGAKMSISPATYTSEARYWKNGVAKTIGNNESVINSVFVQGNDVYFGGYSSSSTPGFKPSYWKNDEPIVQIPLALNEGGIISSIAVSGSDVYLTGMTKKPFIVKNGVIKQLSSIDFSTAQQVVLVTH